MPHANNKSQNVRGGPHPANAPATVRRKNFGVAGQAVSAEPAGAPEEVQKRKSMWDYLRVGKSKTPETEKKEVQPPAQPRVTRPVTAADYWSDTEVPPRARLRLLDIPELYDSTPEKPQDAPQPPRDAAPLEESADHQDFDDDFDDWDLLLAEIAAMRSQIAELRASGGPIDPEEDLPPPETDETDRRIDEIRERLRAYSDILDTLDDDDTTSSP